MRSVRQIANRYATNLSSAAIITAASTGNYIHRFSSHGPSSPPLPAPPREWYVQVPVFFCFSDFLPRQRHLVGLKTIASVCSSLLLPLPRCRRPFSFDSPLVLEPSPSQSALPDLKSKTCRTIQLVSCHHVFNPLHVLLCYVPHVLPFVPQTKIVQEVSPNQLRAQEKAAAIRQRSRNASKKSEGVFTPPQVSQYSRLSLLEGCGVGVEILFFPTGDAFGGPPQACVRSAKGWMTVSGRPWSTRVTREEGGARVLRGPLGCRC